MEIFTEKAIKKCTGAVTFQRGETLYSYGTIDNLKVSEINEFGKKKIEAVVYEGIDKNNNNCVEIDLDYEQGKIDGFKCQCDDFMNLKGKKACKHIVAAFLMHIKPVNINKQKELLENHKDINNTLIYDKPTEIEVKHKISENLKSYSSQVEPKEIHKSTSSKVFAKVKYKFTITNKGSDIYISLAIGENRVYNVTNIIEFINSYRYKNYSVGCEDGFVFLPTLYEFYEKDQEIINIISSKIGTNYKPIILKDSELKIDKEQVETLIEHLRGKHFDVSYNGRNYSKVKICYEDMPLEFMLSKDFKGNWVMNHVNETPLDLLDEGKYYFYKGNIYSPSIKQMDIYRPIYKRFSVSNSTSIDFTESSSFIENRLIPKLKDISLNVEVNDNKDDIKRELNSIKPNESFKTYIHLEKKLAGLAMNIKFVYGDIEMDIFSSDKFKKAALIENRQIMKERPIINVIKNMGFEMTRNYFLMEDEDAIMEFMLYYFQGLSKFAEVTHGDDIENMKLYTTSEYDVNVGITEKGMLEFSFDIQGVNRWEFKDIFNAMERSETYYRSENGKFIYLRDAGLRSLNKLIKYIDTESSFERDKNLVSSRHNVFYVEQYIRENEMLYVKKNNEYKKLIESLDMVSEKEVNLPEKLGKTLRSYQKTGVKWIKTLATMGFGGILADEMGLGKTLQAIAFIVNEQEQIKNSGKPAIVIAPTSLVYNWEGEIKKFAPELKTLVIYGLKRDREKLIKEIQNYDVVITSYAVIRNDINDFENIEFSYCFIDEAQQIKNPRSLNTRAVKRINSYSRFALTGTPMENSMMELWSIFDFIMPSYLLSQKRFNKKYEEPIVIGRSKEALEDLKKHINPFMLRRLKKEVLKELPDKLEHTILVDMTEEQKIAYASYVNKAKNKFSQLEKQEGVKKSKIHILSAITGLRQICSSPSSVFEGYDGDSGKLEVLSTILDESIEGGHRILIFSQFLGVLSEISNLLKEKDIDYMYIDGSTKSQDRYKLVEEFNEGKGDVFLLSLKAGGFGLNLTGADTVIHFDPWWNPAVEEQATDRVHRIGQMKNVEVIKLVAKGTIEEKILKLQEKKKEIIEDVISKNSAEDIIISSLTEEELEDLFTY